MTHRDIPLPYPEEIAAWWLEHIQRQLAIDDTGAALEKLAPYVQQLSDRFIAEEGSRPLQAYGQDSRMLLAYGAFFFPQTFARVQFPLAELLRRGWQPEAHTTQQPMRILDWGAGLGAASLGALHWLLSSADAEYSGFVVDAVEVASESLKRYRALVDSLQWPGCDWHMYPGDMRTPEAIAGLGDGPWDLIIASFSLNEAFEREQSTKEGAAALLATEAWIQWQLERLAPGGLLLILEPASQVACERLGRVRDALVANQRAFVWAPCLHQQSCPMLGRDGGWCHEVHHWPIPAHLQWLNRRMYRALEHLKFGFLALGTSPPPAPPSLALRLVAPMTQKKGRWLTTGCAQDGALWPLELQTRDLDSAAKQTLKQAARGDLMVIEGDTKVEVLARHPHSGLIRLPKTVHLQPLFDGDDSL